MGVPWAPPLTFPHAWSIHVASDIGARQMNAITVRHQTFGRYDLIRIGKANYRYVRWEAKDDEEGTHVLQLALNGLLQDDFRRLTDRQVADQQRRKNFKVEPGYFSSALDELRMRHDDSNLLALSEEQVRTVMWKTEWCVRFHGKRQAPEASLRPKLTNAEIGDFIEDEKDAMNRWYIRKFKEARPLGRPVTVGKGKDKERKPFDYPSPSALRNWLRLYSRTSERMAAFAPRYHRCGNRKQLDSELSAIIDKCVDGYADRSLPTRADIFNDVEVALKAYNKKHKHNPPKTVSQTTINRRIAKLEPFFVDVGRLGVERAIRKYTLVGKGVDVDLPFERIEMDDWEADLQVLLAPTELWSKMTKKQRAAVARVRCTVTVAIDCRTRCIVGLNVSETTPSTPASIATLKSITEDKARMAKYAGAQQDWPMFGRPDGLFTDGGPVFQAEFRDAAAACGIDATRPDPDPRQRGTIESFFRYLRRACRKFTGQTFSNVVVKADYDAEKFASLTVEEFRKVIIRFIVDIYHNRAHRGLADETPISVWNRLTKDGRAPATITPAQRRAAFGFRCEGVRLDNQGVLYCGISYNSAALAEILMKRGMGYKVNLVVDPDDLGDVFVHVPHGIRKHMQSKFPMQMHDEFLVVPAVDKRFEGVPLSARLAGNAAVLDFVKQSQKEGAVYRIDAHEASSEKGKAAARRAGFPTHLLTRDAHDRVVAKFRVASGQATGAPPVGDAPVPSGQSDLGEVAGTSKRTKPRKPPVQENLPAQQAVPSPSPQDQMAAQPVPPRSTGSRSVNQGDED